jgi:hypothetical protein
MAGYVIADNVLMRRLKEEAVLLDIKAGQYYGLDDIGVRLLDKLTVSTDADLHQLAMTLADEYDASAEEIHGDLVELATELVDVGLLAEQQT